MFKVIRMSLISLAFLLSMSVVSASKDYPTISKEAATAAAELDALGGGSVLPPGKDKAAWRSAWEANEQDQKAGNDAVVKTYGALVRKLDINGVPVVEIKPRNWRDNGKVLIYTHGGAYTLFSAESTLISSVPVAEATGLRVISVDYTVAPEAKWKEITAQVVSVIEALLEEGYKPSDVAIYGDSAGGGLAAGALLRARDEGIPPLAALVLWSPWSDITETGDTYLSLRDHDPLLTYKESLEHAADAYAEPADQKHPYVSPVYGEYSKGFPPTLIQVGTREIFFSNAVRHYRALDDAGIEVVIDPYEGMWHVFQAFHWELPESEQAREKVASFLKEHLNYE